MTLFSTLTDEQDIFRAAIAKYFGGQLDRRTLELLAQ
jgi:uncharacterized protein (DUF1810 family)